MQHLTCVVALQHKLHRVWLVLVYTEGRVRFTTFHFILVQYMCHHSRHQSCSIAGEPAGHCQQLQQLLMLVPSLADVSTASIQAAVQGMETCAVSSEAPIRHLEAAGELIQRLCQAGPPAVGQTSSCAAARHRCTAQLCCALRCVAMRSVCLALMTADPSTHTPVPFHVCSSERLHLLPNVSQQMLSNRCFANRACSRTWVWWASVWWLRQIRLSLCIACCSRCMLADGFCLGKSFGAPRGLLALN